MKDNFGREINYLRISVTDRCNLRCRYCMPESGFQNIIPKEQILSFEEIVRLAQAAAKMGISKVRLTGGEPLVRHGIVDSRYRWDRRNRNYHERYSACRYGGRSQGRRCKSCQYQHRYDESGQVCKDHPGRRSQQSTGGD